MTCIVGVVDQEDNTVCIGGDSAAVAGNCVTKNKSPKVFKGKQGIVYGGTTSFRMIQLIRHAFDPGPIPDDDEQILEWMTVEFMQKMQECFKEHGFAEKNNGGQEVGGTFLCAVRSKLFEVYSDYQVDEPLYDYAAVGSGSKYALGALHSLLITEPVISARDRVRNALKATAYHCSEVCGPYTLLST